MNIVEGEGLPDFLLLDKDSVTPDGFLANLRKRFEAKQIHTYLGEQIVLVNPFERQDDLYGREKMATYKRKYLYEVQPHIYALGDDTYRNMLKNKDDQCVIITGESGAGKTEASKTFLQYVCGVSSNEGPAEQIKDKLIASNPVLEAFGNAKTVRNNNSSRFGKYLTIKFDYTGAPLGGRVDQYLLEQYRVISHHHGERAFHILYALLHAPANVRNEVGLGNNAEVDAFRYLRPQDLPPKLKKGRAAGDEEVESKDAPDEEEAGAKEHKAMFLEVQTAMKGLGFTDEVSFVIFRVLAAILHIGNIDFCPAKLGTSDWSDVAPESKEALETASDLLGVTPNDMKKALRSRLITTGISRKASRISILLTVPQAEDARDSLARALYNAVFTFVVKNINRALAVGDGDQKEEEEEVAPGEHRAGQVVIGVLDIYGFEIFQENSFEQFCINYCNEKLQQVFIELVLKREQEEYAREGIEWTEIEYFDNAPIVTLVEKQIIKLLDDKCSVGRSTPKELLETLDRSLTSNPHYSSFASDKSIHPTEFRVQHYAGEVDYDVALFLDKNRDAVSQDLCKLIATSTKSKAMHEYFPVMTLSSRRQRPKTAGTQFKINVNALIERLKACSPHYIRCIKSNDEKKAFVFNEDRIRHQVRYLNLVETLRVRRAGFCNRQAFERFYARYHLISDATWPVFEAGMDKDDNGSSPAGIRAMLDDVKIDADEYRIGKTQIFIRDARTLSRLEELRNEALPRVAVAMQRWYRGFRARASFAILKSTRRLQTRFRRKQEMKKFKRQISALRIQCLMRRYLAVKELRALRRARKRKLAAMQIQRVVRGHLGRVFVKKHRERLEREKKLRQQELLEFNSATTLQSLARRFLHRRWFLRLAKQFGSEAEEKKESPGSYVDALKNLGGAATPWPKYTSPLSKQVQPVLKRMHSAHCARLKIKYWRALQALQRVFRARERRAYVKDANASISAPAPNFGKEAQLPRAYTPGCVASAPILQQLAYQYWAWRKVRYQRAVERMQAMLRAHLRRHFVSSLAKALQEHPESKQNFGKRVPHPTPVVARVIEVAPILFRLHAQHWARRCIASLNDLSYMLVKRKIQAYRLFEGKKFWDPTRPWDSDYMDNDSNAHLAKYTEMVQTMYSTHGSTQINFSDVLLKLNRHGKVQKQVIIVTDKHIHKYRIDKYKQIKDAIDLDSVLGIKFSGLQDTFMVIRCSAPMRDMVLDCGRHGCERYSELATVIYMLLDDLFDRRIPIEFDQSIVYNNSRTETVDGKDVTLSFLPSKVAPPKQPEGYCMWKNGKKGLSSSILIFGTPEYMKTPK